MAGRRWRHPRDVAPQGREATLARIVEAIDRTAPETKERLAGEVGISDNYLSELLQELKREGAVRKAYVIDEDAVYDLAASVSPLRDGSGVGEGRSGDAPPDAPTPSADDDPSVDQDPATDGRDPSADRGDAVLDLLADLEAVTADQYDAARAAFLGGDPDPPAAALESLANERYCAVLSELKSYTLTTDWPGNRVAADLATVATNFEIVGDRACFVADAVGGREVDAAGVVEERVRDVFDAGDSINDHLRAVVFEADLGAYEELLAEEEAVHRDLDELFELVTAYDPEVYGYLVSVTRALERAIYYWVHSAEIAVSIHSGIRPNHVTV
ncbi:MAG: PhoU family transcriptional regulator [Halobacteriales archaeon]